MHNRSGAHRFVQAMFAHVRCLRMVPLTCLMLPHACCRHEPACRPGRELRHHRCRPTGDCTGHVNNGKVAHRSSNSRVACSGSPSCKSPPAMPNHGCSTLYRKCTRWKPDMTTHDNSVYSKGFALGPSVWRRRPQRSRTQWRSVPPAVALAEAKAAALRPMPFGCA